MILKFSEKNHPKGRHLVLITEPGETYDVRKIVHDEVLQNKARAPEELNAETGRTRFRLSLRFIDRIILCLPRCTLSPAIHKYLSDKEEERLNSFPNPKIDWPLMKKGAKLRRYQKVGAAMIVDKAYAARCGYPDVIPFLNDGLGLGKSYIAAAAMAYKLAEAREKGKKYPMLVVCPNNVKLTWMLKVIEKCFDMSAAVLTAGMSYAARQKVIDSEPDVLIVNFEAIRATPIHKDDNVHKKIIGWKFSNPALFVKDWHRAPYLMEKEIAKGNRNLRRYGMIVIDEHHTVKTPDAQVTRGFFQLRAKKWLMMSGTPILNRPEEIWTCLHKLFPKMFPSYGDFMKTLASGSSKKAYSVDAMAELKGFINSISLRRRKEHVVKDLPKSIKVVRKIPMTPEQRKLYTRIEEKFELVLDSGEVKSIMGVLPQITRLKQAAFSPELYEGSKHSAKMVELRAIVQELVDEGEKAIIFSQWSTATRIIERELKDFNPAYVTGEIKNEYDRQREQDRFNEDPNCVLPGTLVTPVGRVLGASRSLYDGPVVDLVVGSGKKLSVTMNHPVLTDRGWLAAHLVRKGDKVLHGPLAPSCPPGPDFEQVPSRAEDLFDAISMDGLSSRSSVSSSNFHGDGKFHEGEVEIVAPKGVLLDEVQSSFARHLGELDFLGANSGAVDFSGPGGGNQAVFVASAASNSSVGGFDGDCVVGSGLDGNAPLSETTYDNSTADAATAGDLLDRFSVSVSPNEIVEVRKIDRWRGHVYNFRTESGTYLANSTLVHNCHVYIGTVQANREGVNLGAGTYVIFTDTAWSPGRDIDQPIGRSAAGGLRGEHHGPDQKVHIIYLQMEETIEEWIDDVLAGKRGVFDRMIERDGGAEIKEVTVKDIRRLIKAQKKQRKQPIKMAA